MKGVTKFTEEWYKIGIILEKEMEHPVPFLPKQVWVETGRFKDIEEAKQTLKRSIEKEEEEIYERPTWVDENPRKHR